MTSQEIVEKVKVLNLPIGSYIVFGSCPLAAVNLREAGDIDILVSDAVLGQLRKAGWKEINKGPSDKPLAYDTYHFPLTILL
jgi:hypothetical protein